MPCVQIFSPDGVVSPATRGRWLYVEDIKQLLRDGPIQFVVANLNDPFRWIPVSDRFNFWKSEVQQHVVDTDEPVYLGDFPGEYLYHASLWEAVGQTPIVLLEMAH